MPGTSWNDGSGDSDSDGWVSTNLSSLLVSLGQSPIDQTKIGRKRFCEDKLSEGIRKKLKLGKSKEVEEYQELLDQLKKKFDECSNKTEKLQVLTVLPQS